MYCKKCGKEIKTGARFCGSCGTVVAAQPPVTEHDETELVFDDKYPFAAKETQPERAAPPPAALKPATPSKPPKPPKKKSGKKPVIIALSILLFLLIVGMGGVAAYMFGAFDAFLYKDNGYSIALDDDDEDEEEDPDEVETAAEDTSEDDDREPAAELPTPQETAATAAENLPPETSAAGLGAAGLGAPVVPTEPVTTTAAMPTVAGQMPTTPYTAAAMPAETTTYYNAGATTEYIIPDSSSRSLTMTDLTALTKDQLRLARNEIYARHGRIFTSDDLISYFSSKSWYRGTVQPNQFSESRLSQIEKDNILLIKQKEESMP